MPYRKYTKEEYDKVMLLRSQGYGYSKISKMTGIPGGTIYTWYANGREPYCIWSEEKKTRVINAMKQGCKTPEYREKLSASKRGSLNPNWKGDEASESSARERARRMYGCPEGMEIHHIDGNPYNNEPENIEFVTRRGHMEEDGRLKELIHRNEISIRRLSELAKNRSRDDRGRFTDEKSKLHE